MRGPRFVGDTAQARAFAGVLSVLALLPLLAAGFVALTWQRAQDEGWSENPRVPHAGDPFPWGWVVLGVVACAVVVRAAVRQWRRYGALRADDRTRERRRPVA